MKTANNIFFYIFFSSLAFGNSYNHGQDFVNYSEELKPLLKKVKTESDSLAEALEVRYLGIFPDADQNIDYNATDFSEFTDLSKNYLENIRIKTNNYRLALIELQQATLKYEDQVREINSKAGCPMMLSKANLSSRCLYIYNFFAAIRDLRVSTFFFFDAFPLITTSETPSSISQHFGKRYNLENEIEYIADSYLLGHSSQIKDDMSKFIARLYRLKIKLQEPLFLNIFDEKSQRSITTQLMFYGSNTK